MNRQATNWEEILANYISNKGLVARKCKDFSKLNSENKNRIAEWAKDINRHFIKENTDDKEAHEKMFKHH